MFRFRSLMIVGFAAALAAAGASARPESPDLTVVVMDPLATPLSCPCVKGYGQRDYDKLCEYLSGKLSRKVIVVYSGSLTKAFKESAGKADLIIGKRSVVIADTRKNKLAVTPVAALTGKDGVTTMNGLIVVPKNDPAKTVADLKGYRIIFGMPESDEKYSAPIDLLKEHRLPAPAKIETNPTCAESAKVILEAGDKVRVAAVISSYAVPLLEGCGTIQKGDLRVVGKTLPVPFIDAFVADALPAKDRAAIKDALLTLIEQPPLLVALETQKGFVAEPSTTEKKDSG